jgi:hypothetical protein
MTCELLVGPLKAAAEAVCRQYVAGLKEGAAEDGPLEFAGACAWCLVASLVIYKHGTVHGQTTTQSASFLHTVAYKNRSFDNAVLPPPGKQEPPAAKKPGGEQQLQRPEATALLAAAMGAAASARGAKVNLKAPKVVIIAEVVPVMLAGRLTALMGLAVTETARLMSVKAKGLQVRSVNRQ